MLILAGSTFTTGNEWIIWMNYCWIFAFTVCVLIRNMADENEWNFWDYLCGGIKAVFGAIGSIARPFGDGNDFARLREKKENGKARDENIKAPADCKLRLWDEKTCFTD